MENMEIRLPETLMDKTEKYTLSTEERNSLIEKSISLLRDFDYAPTLSGVTEIIREWEEQNGWLINLFSKHPNYNGNFQIVLPAQLRRPINMDGIDKFIEWSANELKKSFKEVKIGMFTVSEYTLIKDRMYNLYISLDRLGQTAQYNGHSASYYKFEWQRMTQMLNKKEEEVGTWRSIHLADSTKYITSEDCRIYRAYNRIVGRLLSNCQHKSEPNIITADDCAVISEYADTIGVKPTVGQRVVKYIRKILVKFGLDHIVDIKKRTWWAGDAFCEREVDMGYNHYMALLGDSINPLDVPSEVVISVNPIDFWTMSFGYNWASCHTIDKENTRGNGSDNYHGCYSSGTESYMLDSSSFIVYSRPDADQLKRNGEEHLPMELQSKMKRCVFMVGEDKLVQSRLYPDGRDGGNEGLAAQFRKIVQTTIADLYNTSNLWTLRTGTYECRSVINTTSGSTHYTDYSHYDDCNVSYLRRVDGLLNTKPIQVGAKPICPICGDRHTESEWITCDNCRNEVCCAHCGAVVNEDYGIFVDGNWYCDDDCAHNAGYVCSYDDGWHREYDCTYEEYSGEWYYYTDEGVWVDEMWFHNGEAANDAGYTYCDFDDTWTSDGDAIEIGNTGMFFDTNIHDEFIVTDNGLYFPNATIAMEHGFYQAENGEWTDEVNADGDVAV